MIEGYVMTAVCGVVVLAYGALVWVVTKHHS